VSEEVAEGMVAAVEALLFAAGGPVKLEALCAALDDADPDEMQRALSAVTARCGAADRGLEVVVIDGGWQVRTQARFAAAVLRLRGARPQRLSRAALEVLAVVAYRQPVTRGEIEAIRGVDSGGVLKTLLDRLLVRVGGRRDEPGRPLQYATTPQFLEMFSLPGLGALPTLREREELLRDRPPDDAEE
jgi:segregation and condensation protein B